jgi:hypothetical protein
VAGIDAAEAVRRLAAATVSPDDALALSEELWIDPDHPDHPDHEDWLLTVAVTDVPGGCVVSQPWGFGASMPLVALLLSAGTVCYGMYANPKSDNQGHLVRDGVIEGWDLHPGGGWSDAADPPDQILHAYLYEYHAVASCYAHAGLQATDARALTGPPDQWVRLPSRDYWATRLAEATT